MRNTSSSVGKSRRAEILSNFMKKMKRSGYCRKTRRNVLLAGLKGYFRMVKEEEAGGRKVNRPRWEGASSRRLKKLGAKANWFKRKGKSNIKVAWKSRGKGRSGKKVAEENTEIESIMFVPHTPGGELARILQEADDKFRKGKGLGKIKMVERGGTTLKQILCRSNPWVKEGCGRGNDCFPCRGEGGAGGNCQQEGIVYKISCEQCKVRGVTSEYVGESSRTAFLRGAEHLADLASRSEKSPLWKHCTEEHAGVEVQFRMRVVRKHRTPLTRQIQESVEIENSAANILMNSKGEYNGSRIPRIVVEVGEKVEIE